MFTIYLPRCGDDAGNGASSERALEAPRGRGETVLIVEDEASILRLGKAMLERAGYRVLVASEAEEAMQIAETHADPIHLLMTDVVMPRMNGRELANRMKERHPELRVLFMSGYTANVIAHHGVLDRDVSFVQKPFSRQDLGVAVRKAIDGRPEA
jgi:DNA-binding NtrC family response regulator